MPIHVGCDRAPVAAVADEVDGRVRHDGAVTSKVHCGEIENVAVHVCEHEITAKTGLQVSAAVIGVPGKAASPAHETDGTDGQKLHSGLKVSLNKLCEPSRDWGRAIEGYVDELSRALAKAANCR